MRRRENSVKQSRKDWGNLRGERIVRSIWADRREHVVRVFHEENDLGRKTRLW